MSAALIFVCSNDVGPYLNALAYLSDKHNISDFKFVFVTGAMIEGPQTSFVETIVLALEDLASGTYEKRCVEIDARTAGQYATLAANLKSNSRSTEVVSLDELPDLLAKQVAETGRAKLFVDVTGLPKILMARVLLVCLVGGFHVYAFELRHRVDREFPERSLYFAMPPGAFDYPPLARDLAVHNSVRQLINVRRVLWITAMVSLVGVVCFATLLLIDSSNTVLAVVGLAANIIGIASGALQALATRSGP
ncbi:hypothetical protein Sru01_16440 [Sphaerisporangium rufum]|uniref:Uncharacterized protein n=1 Tax=Sphaerisporangium rufum TaxID=1381558 RepID=A0A919UZT6_9ACTN|nr:hypothetical protein [Sphaerisporangium rufum]GII76662.1 hypothetical protein Sru01_16440 [Sphaerisporangium rufum]